MPFSSREFVGLDTGLIIPGVLQLKSDLYFMLNKAHFSPPTFNAKQNLVDKAQTSMCSFVLLAAKGSGKRFDSHSSLKEQKCSLQPCAIILKTCQGVLHLQKQGIEMACDNGK